MYEHDEDPPQENQHFPEDHGMQETEKEEDPVEVDQYEEEEEEDEPERPIGLIIALVVVGVLMLALLANTLISEFSTPLFGKNKARYEQAQQAEKLSAVRDSLVQLNGRIYAENDLLREQLPSNEGVFFEVQIGAFESFDLDAYNLELANLKGEMHDNMNKYTLARFSDLRKAKAFLRDVQKLGFHDAWIVGKVDGVRVEVETALKESRFR